MALVVVLLHGNWDHKKKSQSFTFALFGESHDHHQYILVLIMNPRTLSIDM